MKRKEVIDCLESERDYQDEKWGSPQKEDYISFPMSHFILDIEAHLNKMKIFCYDTDTDGVMNEMRKIGALSVKFGEVHGMKKR